jgi:hypothetical protein
MPRYLLLRGRGMKLLAISIALALGSSAAVAAAPDASLGADEAAIPFTTERIELARRFVASGNTSSDQYAEVMLADADEMIAALIEEYEGDPRQQKISLAMNKMLTRAQARVRALVPHLIEASAQAYAREFSEDELRQLVTFAESPAGRHYIGEFETIQQDPAVAAVYEELWSTMDEITEEVGKELCTRSHDVQIALGEGEACPYAEESVTRRG